MAGSSKLVSVEWYNGHRGHVYQNSACLAIAYDNGRCQLMKNESDDGDNFFYTF